jgi:sugar phosphate isomerase/epimerase
VVKGEGIPMIQYGVRFHDTKELPLKERLQAIRAQGFTCTHIALSKAGLPGKPENLTPGYAMYLRKAFEAAGVDIAVLGCYLNLANPGGEALRQTQKTYTANLRFARLLGAGVVGTETGAPNEDYHYDKEACHSEAALDTFIGNLRPVVRDAEKAGVILAIEPVYRHIVYNPKRARIVLDSIDSPNLQIIFDPVNLLDVDNIDHADEVIDEAIDLLGRDVVILHLKDYQSKGTHLEQLAPGLGEMHYESVLRFAKERKPFIQATLENTQPDNAEAAREFLTKIEAEV